MGAHQSTVYSNDAEVDAQLDYNDPYVQPLILKALRNELPQGSVWPTNSLFNLITDRKVSEESPARPLLQVLPYERIDFELALRYPQAVLINAYVIRKALIRKHFLANTVAGWVAKRPESVLKQHVKVGVAIELDYVEYLEEALSEAWEVRDSMERNSSLASEAREWWILKPGMADGGKGIRLFSTEDELTAIFEEFEAADEDEDDDEEEAQVDGDGSAFPSEKLYASQLRHFVAQPYIHPPLLPDGHGGRKFHIRTYVLAVGALKVYVYRPMLALFAADKYQAPWESSDLKGHLTNTCLQGSTQREGSVTRFWDLDDHLPGTRTQWQESVFSQICSISGELFRAAALNEVVHFQCLPNAFEIFGIDFMVDAEGTAWLLEVNAFPDFKQTGEDLSDLISCLAGDIADLAVKPFFYPQATVHENDHPRMKKVLDLDLGRI